MGNQFNCLRYVVFGVISLMILLGSNTEIMAGVIPFSLCPGEAPEAGWGEPEDCGEVLVVQQGESPVHFGGVCPEVLPEAHPIEVSLMNIQNGQEWPLGTATCTNEQYSGALSFEDISTLVAGLDPNFEGSYHLSARYEFGLPDQVSLSLDLIPLSPSPSDPDLKVFDGSELLSDHDTIDFGIVTPFNGDASIERTITIRNDGAGPLNISDVFFTQGEWTIMSPPSEPLLLNSGAEVDVRVRLDQAASGVYWEALRIVSDDPDEPRFDVNLNATLFSTIPPEACNQSFTDDMQAALNISPEQQMMNLEFRNIVFNVLTEYVQDPVAADTFRIYLSTPQQVDLDDCEQGDRHCSAAVHQQRRFVEATNHFEGSFNSLIQGEPGAQSMEFEGAIEEYNFAMTNYVQPLICLPDQDLDPEPGCENLDSGQIPIRTPQELQNMTNDGDYVLCNDLDMSVLGDSYLDSFTPIGGRYDSFQGSFDGRGHTISNLSIIMIEQRQDRFVGSNISLAPSTSANYYGSDGSRYNSDVGLFRRLENATVRNVNFSNPRVDGYLRVGVVAGIVRSGSVIEDVNITQADIYGRQDLGIIAGSTDSRQGDEPSIVMQRLQTSGSIQSPATCAGRVGGVLGLNFHDGLVIRESQFLGGFLQHHSGKVGGILGDSAESANIENVFVAGTIGRTESQTQGEGCAVGGVVGMGRNTHIRGALVNSEVSAGCFAGGVAGVARGSSLVEKVQVIGDISANHSYGGITGILQGYSQVKDAASFASLSLPSTSIGGLVGVAEVAHSDSQLGISFSLYAGPGLLGVSPGERVWDASAVLGELKGVASDDSPPPGYNEAEHIHSLYFDSERWDSALQGSFAGPSDNISYLISGFGRSSSEMMSPATYVGWGDRDSWDFDSCPYPIIADFNVCPE